MVPQGAQVIDASGKYVMPGIIDCHSHIAADSINEGSVSVSSMVGIEDVLNPEDIAIYRALAGGVTTANMLHGSANSIGGKCTVIKMRWGKDAHGLIFEGATPGIKFALGENPKRAGNPQPVRRHDRGRPRYPATRMGVEDVIREAFTDAKAYQADWRDYKAKVATRRERDSAAARSETGAAGGSAGRQALRARALLPRRRDPDAAARGRRVRLQDPHAAARAGRLQGGEGDRGARRGRIHVQRLVGVQDGSLRRDSVQRRDHDAQGRAGFAELRRCGTDAAPEYGSRQDHEVRRADARPRRCRW